MPPAAKPAWSKGIQPISRESYYHAIECGKQGGAQSPCVFYDADLCKNEDYVLSLYSPYKQVAYEVWLAASRKQEPPTPSYRGAQQTRVVLGVTPVRGAKNPLAKVAVKRGGKTIPPDTSTLDGGGGNFIFDFPAFAPTATRDVGADRQDAHADVRHRAGGAGAISVMGSVNVGPHCRPQ